MKMQTQTTWNRFDSYCFMLNPVDKVFKLAMPLLVLTQWTTGWRTTGLRNFVSIGRGAMAMPLACRLLGIGFGLGQPREDASRELLRSDQILATLVGLIAAMRTVRTLDHPAIRAISLGVHKRTFIDIQVMCFTITSTWGVYHSFLEESWADNSSKGEKWVNNKTQRCLAGRTQSLLESLENIARLFHLPMSEGVQVALQIGARISGCYNQWMGTQEISGQ